MCDVRTSSLVLTVEATPNSMHVSDSEAMVAEGATNHLRESQQQDGLVPATLSVFNKREHEAEPERDFESVSSRALKKRKAAVPVGHSETSLTVTGNTMEEGVGRAWSARTRRRGAGEPWACRICSFENPWLNAACMRYVWRCGQARWRAQQQVVET